MPAPALRGRALLVLFFVSGFAALTYQVLWVRELGLLFGSTAQAAAMTIAIFFAGIASGGWFWGRRAPRLSSSLRWFGLLEIGVAAAALGHFVLIDVYDALYPALYTLVGGSAAMDTAIKAVVAATVLLPPAFLMGGTLPLMGQHLIDARDRLGRTGSRLYAVNTAGSAAGALCAGFVLPMALGFRNAYLLAVGLDVFVGVSAVLLARREPRGAPGAVDATSAQLEPSTAPISLPPETAASPRSLLGEIPPRLVWIAAFVSGFATLAVEVLWTRLFAQVLQNSVYTYALVLTTFLLALSLGAGVANLLCRITRTSPEAVLAMLLVLSAVVTASSPWLFYAATDGLAYVGSDLGWNGYLAAVTGVALIVMLVPGTVLGAVLPYLLRMLQGNDRQPGEMIGRLIGANTAGAILGSLAAGFVLLPLVGAWRALLLLAATYPALLVAIALQRMAARRLVGAGLAAAAGIALVAVSPQGLTNVRTGLTSVEDVIEIREGSQAHVAVIERDGSRSIRVNNFYTLGSTGAFHAERDQTIIPLLTHPDPREVFFLGMGTGITAGASLAFPVERIEVCELVADVVSMADAHFDRWTDGLFDDGRARVVAEDGRTCLRRSPDRYDVIVSDLFTPWKAGTGNLYTLEHYEAARERLHDGGQYVQWVPLYQVSEQELGIIAATMDAAFDEVLLWRGDLFSSRSIVALVGHVGPAIIDPQVIVANARSIADDNDRRKDDFLEALALRMYAGNITQSGRYADVPINTDNDPLVEYLAPRTHRQVRVGEARFITGGERERLYDQMLEAVPIEQDPALVLLNERQRGYVLAGRSFSAYRFHDAGGRDALADEAFEDFLDRSPAGSTQASSPSRTLLGPAPPTGVGRAAER